MGCAAPIAAAAAVLAEPSPIDGDRLARQDELTDPDVDSVHASQHHIVAPAGVDDQELPVGPVGPGKGDPAIDRRGDRRRRRRRDGNALFGAAECVGRAEGLDDRPGRPAAPAAPWRRRRQAPASAAPDLWPGRGRARLRRRRRRRLVGGARQPPPPPWPAPISASIRAINSLRLAAWRASSAARSRSSPRPARRRPAIAGAPRPAPSAAPCPWPRPGARWRGRRARRRSICANSASSSRSWASAVGLRLQVGNDRAEQHRGPDRLRHVVRAHQNGGRRAAAHALQHRENVGDHAAPAVERSPQRVLAVDRASSAAHWRRRIWRSASCTLAVVSISAALSRARSARIVSISASMRRR